MSSLDKTTCRTIVHHCFRGFSRSYRDEDSTVTAHGDLTVWEYIANDLRRVDYIYDGETVSFVFDATHVVSLMRDRARFEALPLKQQVRELQSTGRSMHPDGLEIAVEVHTSHSLKGHAMFLALRHIANLYLLANIACPGSFGTNALTVRVDDGDTYQPHVRLGGVLFEDALLFAQQNRWPDISPFDPGILWTWLRSLGLSVQETETQSVLAALFSLLHAAEAPFATPTAMLWTAQALETLFGARRGAIAAKLVSRGHAFLKVPGAKYKHFASGMREFYEVRSEFVHGKGVIAHPVFMEAGWGDPVGDEYTRVSDHVAFAVGVIIACVRKLASSGFSGLQFSDQVAGVPLLSSKTKQT